MEDIFNVNVNSATTWPYSMLWTDAFPQPTILNQLNFIADPAHDVTYQATKAIVEINLAGVKKESINVSYDHDKKMLIYGGEYLRKTDKDVPQYGNRPSGKFVYSIAINKVVDIAKCTATYELGVLTVSLPFAPEKNSSIPVK